MTRGLIPPRCMGCQVYGERPCRNRAMCVDCGHVEYVMQRKPRGASVCERCMGSRYTMLHVDRPPVESHAGDALGYLAGPQPKAGLVVRGPMRLLGTVRFPIQMPRLRRKRSRRK